MQTVHAKVKLLLYEITDEYMRLHLCVETLFSTLKITNGNGKSSDEGWTHFTLFSHDRTICQ